MVKFAPSMLAADVLCLGDEVGKMQSAGADYLHFDVMDGRFVPNISFGMPVLKAVAAAAKIPCDAHLMIDNPERYIEAFAESGAAVITVHAEASRHLNRALRRIRELNCLAGVALNPATSPECIRYSIGEFDLALIMLVNPGFGGQRMVSRAVEKIAEVKKMLADEKVEAEIEVDGDVNLTTAPALIEKGATVLVAGTAFFTAEDPARFVREIKGD